LVKKYYIHAMRWNNLFDDLESRLDSELTTEQLELDAEKERLRLARLTIRGRIAALGNRGGPDSPLKMTLVTGRSLVVRPTLLGRDWLVGDILDESAGSVRCVVPLRGIIALTLDRGEVIDSVRPLEDADSDERFSGRLGIGFVLRDLCRRRLAVDISLASGRFHGTIDRVGSDHLDLAEHDVDSPRREALVNNYRIVPLDQLVLVTVRR
jgi:hypothetical protein